MKGTNCILCFGEFSFIFPISLKLHQENFLEDENQHEKFINVKYLDNFRWRSKQYLHQCKFMHRL